MEKVGSKISSSTIPMADVESINSPEFVSKTYWRPAEIASKGPARKANCGAKEKAITEFFQILYTEQ